MKRAWARLPDGTYDSGCEMRYVAWAEFEADPALDMVTVHEHGGWWLSYRRDLRIVDSANDGAVFAPEIVAWRKQMNAKGAA